MVSFSESIYRGYRITAWAQSSLNVANEAQATRFIARAVVAGTAAAVMDYRLPVPTLDTTLFAQPATARHHAEAAARAYVDELRQINGVDARETVSEGRYRRARGDGRSQAAA
jgi:hypothetical protein